MHPLSPYPISQHVPLADLRQAFPNPVDLRAALHLTPNGDLYRKICVRDLTHAGKFREAYLFAKEIRSTIDRDDEFKGLIPAFVLSDDKEALEDLYQSCGSEWKELFLFISSLLYLEQGNIPRHYETLITVCDIALNEVLIQTSHAKLPYPQNCQFTGKVIEAYLLDGQAGYAIHLIKTICPKLNPNASQEDLLFAAGYFLFVNDKFNDLALILNELIDRRFELLNLVISKLLDQGDAFTAIGLAKNLPDTDAVLTLMAHALLARQNPLPIALVLNSMGQKRNELIDAIIIPLLDAGQQELAMTLLHALDRDSQTLIEKANNYLRKKAGTI